MLKTYGASLSGDTVSVFGSYDYRYCHVRTGGRLVFFAAGTVNTLTLEIGSVTFSEMDDTGYPGGSGPVLAFTGTQLADGAVVEQFFFQSAAPNTFGSPDNTPPTNSFDGG